MFGEIITGIGESYIAVQSWFGAFIKNEIYLFVMSFFIFVMLYRFLLRPFFYGGASDTVSKKNKSKKR